MNIQTHELPSHDQIKTQAKRLRSELSAQGTVLTHSQSLEMVAHQHGYKNWNTLRAATQDKAQISELRLGQVVTGHYMSKPFTGKLLSLTQRKQQGVVELTVHFDEPVNVSKFESMTILRRRVSSRIDVDGKSPQKTSDGVPIMQIDL